MTPQLNSSARSLSLAGISYWLDFGTLLGFVRNGEVIKKQGDFDDIDLGVWMEDEPKLLGVLRELSGSGYRVYRISLFGQTLMYKLFPKELGEGSLAVDFGVYRKRADGKACFVIPNPVMPDPGQPLVRFIQRLRHRLYFRAWRLLTRGELYRWPEHLPESALWRDLFSYKVAAIQEHLISPVRRDEGSGLSLPARPEEYLAAKYGDWGTPRKSWNFWTDELDLEPCDFVALKSLLGVSASAHPTT